MLPHASLERISHEHVPQDDEQDFIVNAVDPDVPSLVDHLFFWVQ
jgi:hypothetical protein